MQGLVAIRALWPEVSVSPCLVEAEHQFRGGSFQVFVVFLSHHPPAILGQALGQKFRFHFPQDPALDV